MQKGSRSGAEVSRNNDGAPGGDDLSRNISRRALRPSRGAQVRAVSRAILNGLPVF
jgi:hypothetical protein